MAVGLRVGGGGPGGGAGFSGAASFSGAAASVLTRGGGGGAASFDGGGSMVTGAAVFEGICRRQRAERVAQLGIALERQRIFALRTIERNRRGRAGDRKTQPRAA